MDLSAIKLCGITSPSFQSSSSPQAIPSEVPAMTAGSIPAQDKITRGKNERQDKVEERSCGVTAIFANGPFIKEGNSLHIRDFFLSSSSSLNSPSIAKKTAEGQKL